MPAETLTPDPLAQEIVGLEQQDQASLQPQAPEVNMHLNEPLPPVQPGFVRLYRGDVVDQNGDPITKLVSERATSMDTAGRWFTDNPNNAEGYGGGRHMQTDEPGRRMRNQFVDVPADVAHEHNTRNLPHEVMSAANGTAGLPEEWLLPEDIISQAKEYHVKETDRTYEPVIGEGLQEFLDDPDILDYVKGMGITKEDIPALMKDPNRVQRVLEQVAMSLGQRHFWTANINNPEEVLHELYLGVEGAHKERLLGPDPNPGSQKSEGSSPKPKPRDYGPNDY